MRPAAPPVAAGTTWRLETVHGPVVIAPDLDAAPATVAQLSRLAAGGLLPEPHLPPHRPGLRGPGRRPARGRRGRPGLHAALRGLPPDVPARNRGHGAGREGHRRKPVLRQRLTAAAPGRPLHHHRNRAHPGWKSSTGWSKGTHSWTGSSSRPERPVAGFHCRPGPRDVKPQTLETAGDSVGMARANSGPVPVVVMGLGAIGREIARAALQSEEVTLVAPWTLILPWWASDWTSWVWPRRSRCEPELAAGAGPWTAGRWCCTRRVRRCRPSPTSCSPR